MAHPAMVTVEHVEVKRSDLNRIKHLFKLKDNNEAILKAMDLAAGKASTRKGL